MGVLDDLPATAFVDPYSDETDKFQYRGRPVGWSEDLKRIMALPRRVLDDKDPRAAVIWSKHLRRHRTSPCDCDARWGVKNPDTGEVVKGSGCLTELNPVQGWALEECYDTKGLVGIIGVGWGKTLLSILLAWALFPEKAAKPSQAKIVLLVIPSKLKRRFFEKDYPQASAHFEVPNLAGATGASWKNDGRPVLEVVTYNELSSKRNTDLLKRLKPDAVITDEAHHLSNRNSVRTGRFLKVFTQEFADKVGKPIPYYCPMSGTMTDHSLLEYNHHVEFALRDASPVPLAYPVMAEWAAAIDVSDAPAPMGRLRNLCQPGETAQQGFARRLLETKGVISTSEASVKCGLEIAALPSPELPVDVHTHLKTIATREERPDGEQSDGALTTSNWLREMASGFYSYWAFPKEYATHCKCVGPCDFECGAKALIDRWFRLRKRFNMATRKKLKKAREFLDSPELLRDAARRWFDGYEHEGVKYAPRTTQWVAVEFCPRCKTKIDSGACSCGWRARGGPLAVWDSKLSLKGVELDDTTADLFDADGNLMHFEIETWPQWVEIKDQVEPVSKVKWVNTFLVDAAIAWGKANKGLIWTEHKDFARKVAEGLGGGVLYDGGGKNPELEKGDRSIVCQIKSNNFGLNLQNAFCKNLIVHMPTSAKITEQLIGRTHRQGQRADTVEVDVFLHTQECRRAFDTACRRAAYIQTTHRTPQKLMLATIDLTHAVKCDD